MKTEADVQQAHDILIAFILGEVPIQLPQETDTGLRIACDVLCWMLEHDHNIHFQKNLDELMKFAEVKGFALTTKPPRKL